MQRSLWIQVRISLVLALCLLASARVALGQRVFVQPVSREIIVDRLRLAASKNSERMEVLMKQFAEAGCQEVVEQPVKWSKLGNIVCTLPGTGEGTILVGAHFDKANSLGVVDNWSGASLLPSLYQSLLGRERIHTFVFVGFTDEEEGLRGSESYVKQMDAAQRSRMRAMVNIDCVGMTSTKVWSRRADKRLLTALSQVASSLKLPLAGVNVGEVGDTDSLSFVSKKIPVIDVHSVTQENSQRLHEGRDTPDTIRLDDYYDTYKLVSIYLGFLDITLGPGSGETKR
jgi:putative aminopeptidase FrvX